MVGIGVNLRVTGHCNQGGRTYMEDMFSVAYQQTVDMIDLEYAFFGIFDGHGGSHAATYAKENLLDNIVNQRSFWSNDDEEVLKSIKDGFLATHYLMWKNLDSWPTHNNGLPSTSGTTATVAFIMRGKLYYGHVGDSAIVLGYEVKGDPKWRAEVLTTEHKPDLDEERTRIQSVGGKVVLKSGIPRVVWFRPRLDHQGPVRRSTCIDQVPFLAVARSLGDFWSYNSERDEFIVSPEPEVGVYPIDVNRHRCLLFGTDGLWNMLEPSKAISLVQEVEIHNEKQVIYNSSNASSYDQKWLNPSKDLVDKALEMWMATNQRADNTSVVTLMLDPPGPPRAQVLLNQKQKSQNGTSSNQDCFPQPTGVAIFTRYPGGLTTQHSPTHMESNSDSAISIGPKKTVIKRPKIENQANPKSTKTKVETSVKSSMARDEPSCSSSEITKNKTAVSSHPSLKRRTRSDDKGIFLSDGGSDVENERLGANQESDSKKRKIRTDLKNTKSPNCRPSVPKKLFEANSPIEDSPRMLRSDTLAAIPMKTLRSRNVDLRAQSQVSNAKPAMNVRNKKHMTAKSDQSPTAQKWEPPQAMMTRSHGKNS